MPTLRDIATRAGVSTCTVSKILSHGSGHERYSVDCRSRVRAAADALGFSPNHAARALRTGTTGIVAIAIDWAPEGAGDGFAAAMIAACEAAARKRGLHLLVVGKRDAQRNAQRDADSVSAPAPAEESGQSAVRVALSLAERRQCDGLVVFGGKLAQGDLAALRGSRVAASFLCQVPKGFAGAELDDGAGVAEAVRHLVALGHTRFAWIEPTGSDRQDLRREAFIATCASARVDARALRLPAYPGAGDEIRVAHTRAALLARRAELADRTAFVCYHDLTALGTYAALADLGRSIPRDASVIGFDNVHATTALPAMTAVDHVLPALAEAAMAALKDGAGRILVAPRLIIRGSTGPAPIDSTNRTPAGIHHDAPEGSP